MLYAKNHKINKYNDRSLLHGSIYEKETLEMTVIPNVGTGKPSEERALDIQKVFLIKAN